MNALQSLISTYFFDKNLKKSEFIKQLGYANISKGSRRLSEFAELILKNTDIPESGLELAYLAVQNDLESQRRLEFISMIRVIPKRRPSPLYTLILYNIKVPENVTGLSYNKELRIICNLYQEFKIKCPSAQGFKYFRSYDETLEFNVNGELIQ